MQKSTLKILLFLILIFTSCYPKQWPQISKNIKYWESIAFGGQKKLKKSLIEAGGNPEHYIDCLMKEGLSITPKEFDNWDVNRTIRNKCLQESIQWTNITKGVIATPDTYIKVPEIGTISTGAFNPQFSSRSFLTETSTTGETPIADAVFQLLKGETEHNFRKVKVKTPYMEEELYGVLMLSQIPPGCQNSPVTQSYRISVPEEYVNAAKGGRVSCVYEYYTCGDSNKKTTWVLWLSDAPFE